MSNRTIKCNDQRGRRKALATVPHTSKEGAFCCENFSKSLNTQTLSCDLALT